MENINYRQPLRDSKGNFTEWFYWGFIDGEWIGWANQLNGHDTRKESQQFTGKKDAVGTPVYEGATIFAQTKEDYNFLATTITNKDNLDRDFFLFVRPSGLPIVLERNVDLEVEEFATIYDRTKGFIHKAFFEEILEATAENHRINVALWQNRFDAALRRLDFSKASIKVKEEVEEEE